MSQHSHPRSQRGSVGKSPSCQEEEENALQERVGGSALDELQRQVEEELRSSDQVLSRIGSKYSPRASTPLAADRSYHNSFVEDSQMNNYQSTTRTPASNRSRRDSPVTSSGAVAVVTHDDFIQSSVVQDSNFMESAVEESCDRDNQFPISSENESYYNSVVNETAVDTDIPDSYVLQESPAANTSGFNSSLNRFQSTPIQRVSELNDKSASGQNMMLDDHNLTSLPSTKNSLSRSSPVMGSAGKSFSGMGSGAMGPADMSSTIRTPSSKVSCRESSRERISQSLWSNARTATRPVRVDPQGKYLRSQGFTEANFYNDNTKCLDFPDESPRTQGVSSQGTGETEAEQTFSIRRNGTPEAMSSYQKPPSLEAAFRCQTYQRSPNPVAEVGGVSCSKVQSSRAGFKGQLCASAESSRAGTRCQPYQKTSSLEEGAGSQSFQEAQNPRSVTFDNCYSRTQCPEVGPEDQTFLISRNGIQGAMSSSYQRPQNIQASFGNQTQIPVSFRAEAGGQLCQTQEISRSPGEIYQTAPNLQTKSGIHFSQKNQDLVVGGGGQLCQTWSSSQAEVWDDLNLRVPRAEGRRVNTFFQGNLSPIPEICSSFEKSSGTEALFENQLCQTERDFRAEAEARQHQRATSPVSQVSAVGKPCHLPGTNKMAAGGQQYQKVQAQTMVQSCQTPRSPRAEVEDQQYQRGLSPVGQPCQSSRSPKVGAEDQQYQRAQSPISQMQAQIGAQPCQSPRSPKAEAENQQYQRELSPVAQPCQSSRSPRVGAEDQQYQRGLSPVAQSCQSSRSPRAGAEDQQYQRAQSLMPQMQEQTGTLPCQSPRSPRPEGGTQQYQRAQSPVVQMQAEIQPCQSPRSFRGAAGGHQYQRGQSPVVQTQTETQPCQLPESPREGPVGQHYQKAQSYLMQMPMQMQGQVEKQSCQSSGSPRTVISDQPYQERNPMAEPWDNFYLHPPSPVAGAEGQRFAAQPDSGVGSGSQPYQRIPNHVAGASNHAHQKPQSSMALPGSHSHHAEHIMKYEEIESAHQGHSKRNHLPNEKRSQALYRLSQLKKTPSLSQCRVDKDLDFLSVCCPKTKTAEKVFKIPERPCLKRQEIENLVRCESRDVDDALFVSADESTTYKKPCPKQQKAQMSVQALVQAHARHPCQPSYTPLEHPDPEDITPELAAAMMFSQEQGLKMEECPYDIVAHLYPEAPEVPFPRKSRQSNVSVVDSQKEQNEIIEKSASVPSEGVSDSVFSRKMKERGEELEARSSYDVEFAIGQTKRQYVLVTQRPDRVNKIQFRGGSSPLWFPGYFSAFPDEPGLNLVPSPSEVFQKAWVHSNPKNMPTNDVIVLD